MPSPDNQNDRPSPPEAQRLRQEAVGWLARLSDREATIEDRLAFERWQSQSPAHARAFQSIAEVWHDPGLDRAARLVARADSVHDRESLAVRSRWKPALTVAACLSALLLGAVYFEVLTRLQADHQTSVGERRTVRLPDQSLVTLNTQSAIATAFDGTVRKVRLLKGEAFFKVQHDPNRPFVVEGGETTTRAVGTEFVIRQQDHGDRVTVIEGVVDVASRSREGTKERVSAGSMIESESGRLGQARPVDASMASAWLQGLLIVDDVPLAQVLEEIRRYHPGTIVLWNQQIGQRHVTGTYKLDDPSKVLYHLTKTFPLRTVSLADRLVLLF
ncbi:putative Iron dicitrate transmembrane sensor FecR [Nitrospira japonica]|uniref:Putative Iron dicitrate transmembrane sensor FecR n=1 Tax=Nitrospira japonica TaxID=1325564 RepID=A0A1W1IAS8_9BACT|nr:FecR family protein [Nitrospira japonica]SLM50100.1 putative Iron dicitrate transmembrane sensor FecR [Nitrospira japonica]